MCRFTIKAIENEKELLGKAYVHYKSWHETYSTLVNTEYMNTITLEKFTKIAYKRPESSIIAKDGDTVIGFADCGVYRADTSLEYGEVYSIYVLEAYQGKKVGYMLMNAVLSNLVDYNKIVVWVLKGNEKAIRFYEKYGFVFDGTEAEIMLGTSNTELRMIYNRNQ